MRTAAAHFDRRYAASPDPWHYETSEYERDKYARTLAALPRRIGSALEAGCSIGVFTALLAERCRQLEAVDFSSVAVERARERTRDRPGVRVERRILPEELPDGSFDAIVCSELLYYWERELVLDGLRRFEAALAPGGRLVAVHWRHPDPRRPLDGDSVHRLLCEHTVLRHRERRLDPDYLLDAWERPGPGTAEPAR